MARLPLPARRHRDQHPAQDRDDLDADDLRTADLPDARAPGSAPAASHRGWTIRSLPHEVVYAQLGEQRHRRFIKTHTPLDGIPLDPQVTYIVTARDPLDTFVSLCRQNEIIGPSPDIIGPPPGRRAAAGLRPPPPWLLRRRAAGRPPVPPGPPPACGTATGRYRPPPPHPPPASPGYRMPPGPPGPPEPPASREMLHDALLRWIADDDDPCRLPGLAARRDAAPVRCLGPARRAERAAGALRRPARRPGGPDALAGREARDSRSGAGLARAHPGGHVRAHARPRGQSHSRSPWDRRGRRPHSSAGVPSGAGREILSDEEMAGYYARAARLAPPDMLEWLHAPLSLR